MGGGDLNLKKSWHPNTMKNQKEVWEAEQKQLAEERKIKELQKKLKEERMKEALEDLGENSGQLKKKENGDLSWMYKGPGGHVTREEYLLGRKIDKSFEILVQEENKGVDESAEKSSHIIEHEILPQSVIEKRESNVQVDLKRKLLEDPLLAIRKSENATKTAITSNPVKMKQLQLLISSLKTSKKSRSKLKKKKKKSSKKKNKRKKVKKKKESSSNTSSDSESELENSSASKISLASSRMKEVVERQKIKSHFTDESVNTNKREFRERMNHAHSSNDFHKELRLPEKQFLSEQRHYKHRFSHRSGRKSRSRSRDRPTSSRNRESEQEDMETKRRRMMQNAAERDEQRKANVLRYEEERQKELNEGHEHNDDILRNLGSSSVGKSVESRIRSKVSSLQKKSGHMNEHFLKR